MYFALDPHLLQIEQIMTSVPNFRPRCCGVQIYELDLTDSDLPYDALLFHTMLNICNPLFRDRFDKYYEERKHTAMNYRGERHEILFKKELQKREHPSAAMLCALYLLTADCRLWARIKQNVHVSNIHFHDVKLGIVSSDAYILYMTARDLYCGTGHITISDLADKTVVSKKLFGILCDAMTLRRHGFAALTASMKEDRKDNINE